MHAVQIISQLLWHALVIKLGVDWLSGPDNAHKKRSTFTNAFNTAVLFAMLDIFGAFVQIFPLGGLAMLLLKFVATYATISLFFGVKPIKSLLMLPMLGLAGWIWRAVLIPILPFV
ncbi:MAG: hypothetical protein ACJAYU_002903 [Bradymonadia bacterium]|jgi:hypothetical protein